MKTFIRMASVPLLTLAAGSCCEQAEQPWIVDRFDDIKVIRYEVPGFEELPVAQKELIYYLSEAAKCGRDILFDQNCAINLPVRRTLETIYTNYEGDRSSTEWLALEKYRNRVFSSCITNNSTHIYITFCASAPRVALTHLSKK